MHSNFITPPDFITTVLILNATENQILELNSAVKTSNKPYNVYFYNNEMNNLRWLARVTNIADQVIEADKNNPLDFFNK